MKLVVVLEPYHMKSIIIDTCQLEKDITCVLCLKNVMCSTYVTIVRMDTVNTALIISAMICAISFNYHQNAKGMFATLMFVMAVLFLRNAILISITIRLIKLKKNTKELKELDYFISQAVNNGHSIYVGIKEYNLNKSTSTIYRYIDKGLLSVKNIDLKRKVRYRPRKNKKTIKVTRDYDYLKGRDYESFTKRLQEDPTLSFWQMDTIEGIKGTDEAVVLSLLHNKSNLQLYFKLESKTIEEVIKTFERIKEQMGVIVFSKIFDVILTDNGSEFKDPLSIEIDKRAEEKLISIYYCQARRSDQKGKCEKNHEHFREMIPKGISFNNYEVEDINHISLMVNNYPRPMFNFKTPIEVADILLDKKAFSLNNLKAIPTNQVVLKRYIK